MKSFVKNNLPVDSIRRFLEPGPIVLVSSEWKNKRNIMTVGWHTVMGFSPSLIGCYIWNENRSFEAIRKSRECVFNIPTIDLMKETIAIGNSEGEDIDKFEAYGLTPLKGKKIKAPLIKECYANFECKLYETKMIKSYNFFVFEVVHAVAATTPKFPKTFHYRGDGQFMISGDSKSMKSQFKPQYL
ncbi:MAG: flavin reductase family protein [Proteobacteria bacterium]|nr:MAG: flavin reductase family protein [Pseudomonadota bacterium]